MGAGGTRERTGRHPRGAMVFTDSRRRCARSIAGDHPGDPGRCAGVICNAGCSLVSEALHPGKKVLVEPQHGQIEQGSNALARLGSGQVMDQLDTEAVRRWLSAPEISAQRYPDVLGNVIGSIEAGRWHDVHALVRSLRGDVPFAGEEDRVA